MALYVVFAAVYKPKKIILKKPKPAPKEKVAIILGDKSGKKNAITLNSKDAKLKIDKPLTQVKIRENGSLSKPKKISKKELSTNFGNVIKAIPKKAFSTNIFFKNGIKLQNDYIIKLFQIKHEIKRRKPCEVEIIGHSDTKGSNEKNIILSKKRADLIKILIDETKAEIENINIRALGESNLLIATKDNVSQPQNRRVEVIIK
jgi:outer membrane protein OmpA-like peptidoglycan-associated protein